MNQEAEVVCPSCSPKEPVLHDVLKWGQNPVVRCQHCEQVHPAKIEIPKPVRVRVIVSKGEESFKCMTQMTSGEMLYEDDEIVVDDESADEVYPIIVTSIESKDKRLDAAKAEDIDTVWGRAIGEVNVKISINMGKQTDSVTKKVPGDYKFVVGSEDKAEGRSFTINRIKVRDGNFWSRKDDTVAAKYITRVFANPVYKKGWGEGKTAWSMKRNERY
ncbi:MAG: hypothetical protein JXA98_06875 [Methanosarcinaceae archaeon]|nr:hypothetical protein [Methanosarcinaceae archaeon]